MEHVRVAATVRYIESLSEDLLLSLVVVIRLLEDDSHIRCVHIVS